VCSVLQCVAVFYVAVCCSVLQCVVLQGAFSLKTKIVIKTKTGRDTGVQCVAVCCSVLCCSVLQCVAVRCSVLQCVAVCCVAGCFLPQDKYGDQDKDRQRYGCAVCCSVLQRYGQLQLNPHTVCVCVYNTQATKSSWDTIPQCVAAVCCSVLQCVAVCCGAGCCLACKGHIVRTTIPQCVAAVCCSVLRCVTVCCSVLQYTFSLARDKLCVRHHPSVCCSNALHCVAVCCRVPSRVQGAWHTHTHTNTHTHTQLCSCTKK